MKSPLLKDLLLILCCLAVSWALFIAVLLITNLYPRLRRYFRGRLGHLWVESTGGSEGLHRSGFSAAQPVCASVSMFVVFLSLPFILRSSPYRILILTLAVLWIIVALGINIQFGSAGIINLGAAAFYGVGAYTAGMFATRLGTPPLFNLLLGP